MKIDIADRYLEAEEIRTDKAPYEAYYQMLTSVFDLSKMQSFCDVGCSNGNLQQIMRKNHPEIAVHGFEFFEFLKRAADPEILDTIEIVDLRDPLQHEVKYDLVNCTEVGEHIDPEYSGVFLQNLRQLTKRFLVMSWSDSGGEHDRANDPHHQHLNPLSFADFSRLMRDNGFVEIEGATLALRQASYRPHFHDWWRKSLSVWKVKP